MIFGTGVDIVKVQRFEKWIENGYIERFFNKAELCSENCSFQHKMEHYAVRFAAKEAFGKALGCGLAGFDLKDVYVVKDKNGKPFIALENNARKKFESLCYNKGTIHLSLSHEKEYAVAFVVVEAAQLEEK